MGCTGLRHAQRALTDYVDDIAHFVGVRNIGRRPVTMGISAVYQAINAPKGVNTRANQRLTLLCGGHIGAQRNRFTPCAADRLGDLIKESLVAGTEHHLSALSGRQFSERLSETRPHPTDHYHFAI